FQAEDGIRDRNVTGVQTCALPISGGCLWGVQAFIKTLPGVQSTEAGRANGTTNFLEGSYDGYAECVKTEYDPTVVTIKDLMGFLFEVIDPYSLNKQGQDVGE